MPKRIYLAGPDVFLRDALTVAARKKDICRQFGFEGLFPLSQDDAVEAKAHIIFEANCKLMQSADIGVFNLTPFRGPSADCGTAFELGYMFALGKSVHGYSGTDLNYIKRVASSDGPLLKQNQTMIDKSGLLVEDFQRFDNLMLSESITKAGGIFIAGSHASQHDLSAMKAFKNCIQTVADTD